MILDRKRLRAALERVPSAEVRQLISASVALRANRSGWQSVPWKEYRHLVDEVARTHQAAPDVAFVPRSDDELRAAAAGAASDDRAAFRDVVRLDKVEVRQFGSYRDPTTVDLAPIGTRNVTVVVGGNGDGKSTLFNAINFALFGDDFITELGEVHGKKREDLVNHAALEDLHANGGRVETSVVLWFTIAGTHYYVRRRFETELLDGLPVAGLVHTSAHKVDAAGNHPEVSEDSLRQLLSGLPRSVKDFFLFDGERINRFASPGSQRQVRDAIRRIVGVAELEEIAGHLTELAGKLRSEQRKASSSSVAEAVATEELERAALAQYEDEYASLGDGIADLKEMVRTLERKLLESADTREIQKRRDLLKGQLEELVRRREVTAQELRETLAGSALSLALPAVAALRSELDRGRQAGVIPGVVSQQLLRDLLDRGTCLCGTPLRDEDEARRHLEAELEVVLEQGSEREAMLALFYTLDSVPPLVEATAAQAEKHYREYFALGERAELLETDLLGLAAELRDVKVGDRDGWEIERSAKQDQIVSMSARRRDLEARIDESRTKLKELTARVGMLSAAEQESRHLHAMSTWTDAAASSLKAMIQEFSALARVEAERRTTALWRQLLPNVKNYQVRVTEDFELDVTSPVGVSGMAQLAMGQQQCLGLAFITAVAHVAETRPPLVIDMPFGRLSDEVAAAVATALPTLTYQLVLFLLPVTEWNERIKAALAPALARKIELTYDASLKATRVSVAPLQESR